MLKIIFYLFQDSFCDLSQQRKREDKSRAPNFRLNPAEDESEKPKIWLLPWIRLKEMRPFHRLMHWEIFC
jgi:hypothetical protein